MNCPHCGAEFGLFSKALRQIQKSRTCPQCNGGIKTGMDMTRYLLTALPVIGGFMLLGFSVPVSCGAGAGLGVAVGMKLVPVAGAEPDGKTRQREATPSAEENFGARSWKVFRRIVCFTGAFIFGLAGVVLLLRSHSQPQSLAPAVISLVLAALMAWFGLYGVGGRKVRRVDNANGP